MTNQAIRHAIALEQCSLFAADVGQHIAKAMTDAAVYLRGMEALTVECDTLQRYEDCLRTVCGELELPHSESGPCDDPKRYEDAIAALDLLYRNTEAERVRHSEARFKAEAELAWYGEQARLARLIHSEGDAGRHALAADGGKRARAILNPEAN